MILENIKKNICKSENFWRYFLALVFLSAAAFRIFFREEALEELTLLHLPVYLQIFLIIFEALIGLSLLFKKYLKVSYFLLSLFLIFVLSWSLIFFGQKLIPNIKELFVFNINPTDWFLHFIFLLLTLFLLRKEIGK